MVFGHSKPSSTHRQQLRDELTESYNHLKLAAGHAAGGAAEKVTPSYDRARRVAVRRFNALLSVFMPLYAQAKEGAANARRESRQPKTQDSTQKKWRLAAVLLASGAAVGALGAMVARRRRPTTQWDEYEPSATIGDTTTYDRSESLLAPGQPASGVGSPAQNTSGPSTGSAGSPEPSPTDAS